MPRGVFISFEGIDGSGKTEQLFRLAYWLFSSTKKFSNLLATREPTNLVYGRELRKILREETDPLASAEKCLTLFVTDRRIHWEHEIKPTLEAGGIVLCDRFKHSSYAFQSAQGIPLERIVDAHAGIPSPDLVIMLDVPVDEALSRIGTRDAGSNEKFEKRDFMEKLRSNYLALAEKFPRDNIAVIDGTGTREEVFARIRQAAVERGVLKEYL